MDINAIIASASKGFILRLEEGAYWFKLTTFGREAYRLMMLPENEEEGQQAFLFRREQLYTDDNPRDLIVHYCLQLVRAATVKRRSLTDEAGWTLVEWSVALADINAPFNLNWPEGPWFSRLERGVEDVHQRSLACNV